MGMKHRLGRWLRILLLPVFLLTGASDLPAMEPPAPGEILRLKQTGQWETRRTFAQEIGNHKIDPDLLKKAIGRAKHSALSTEDISPETIGPPATLFTLPPGWIGMPTEGDVKVFALLIDFPDYPHAAANTLGSVNEKLFGAGSPSDFPYESLAAYYDRSSYGQLILSGGATLGWYRTAHNRSTISQTTTGRENLIKEALGYFNAQGHDFSQYDNDGDGVIDYFLVIWSGPDTGWAGFWWGYQTTFSDSSFSIDGKRLRKYSWQWESNPWPGTFSPRVTIHETGHALGLPDYYDYDPGLGPDGGVGGLDMMDLNRGDHNCFSKWVLDWISPTVVASGSRTPFLAPSGTSTDAILVMPNVDPNDPFGEFFMVQNRYRAGNDNTTGYPADGLLIWHVDATLNTSGNDYLYNNSYTAHKLLRLMEADGLEEIEKNANNSKFTADAGDYYTPGASFGNDTTPSSRGYSGSITDVAVSDIQASGQNVTARIRVGESMIPRGTMSIDFDGDGKDDIGVWRPSSGVWYILRSSNGGMISRQWGLGSLGDNVVNGDYNGDGKTDVAVWRASTGMWYILRSSDGTMASQQWGLGSLSDVPVPGDYDGDGKTDIAVWRKDTGIWYILRSSDGGMTSQQWGLGSLGDRPVPGDYDGDGKTDVAVWRADTGTWYILRSSDGGMTYAQWGLGIPGRYPRDRRLRRRREDRHRGLETFHRQLVHPTVYGRGFSTTTSILGQTPTQWGLGSLGDIPVPGDYDGDGKTDVAVWRPSSGIWYILRSSDGTMVSQQWGLGSPGGYPIEETLPLGFVFLIRRTSPMSVMTCSGMDNKLMGR